MDWLSEFVSTITASFGRSPPQILTAWLIVVAAIVAIVGGVVTFVRWSFQRRKWKNIQEQESGIAITNRRNYGIYIDRSTNIINNLDGSNQTSLKAYDVKNSPHLEANSIVQHIHSGLPQVSRTDD